MAMENTSYISQISYDIEGWLYERRSLEWIKDRIKKSQKKGEFPPNLELIDAYFDEKFSSSGCAFLDTNTGETIVGFAGTNLNIGFMEGVKDVATDILGLAGGIHEDSRYMQESNEFIRGLKDKGYNITTTTGHSLGGALCSYAAIYHDIPYNITYNGAPIYVFPNTDNAESISTEIENYYGKTIRFVSDEDWLNNGMNWINDNIGFSNPCYLGEKVLFHNGAGHDMYFFLNENEQQRISEINLANKLGNDTALSLGFDKEDNINLSVDFDADGKIDLAITATDLTVKNLFGAGGKYSGNGTNVKIDPTALYNLQANLENNMIGEDIAWIQRVIQLCKDKNDAIKNNRELRKDILCNKIVEGLNEARLTEVLIKIEASHGELIKNSNKDVLNQLRNLNTYSIAKKFDIRSTLRGNKKWYTDGQEFDELYLNNCMKKLKETANDLFKEISKSAFVNFASPGAVDLIRYCMSCVKSDISQAFNGATCSFLSKAEM